MYGGVYVTNAKRNGKRHTMSIESEEDRRKKGVEKKRVLVTQDIDTFKRFVAFIFDLSTFPPGTRFYMLHDYRLRIELPNLYYVSTIDIKYSYIYGLSEQALMKETKSKERIHQRIEKANGNMSGVLKGLDPEGKKSRLPYAEIVNRDNVFYSKKYDIGDEWINGFSNVTRKKQLINDFYSMCNKKVPFIVYDFGFVTNERYDSYDIMKNKRFKIGYEYTATPHRKSYKNLDEEGVDGGLLVIEIHDGETQRDQPWFEDDGLMTYKKVVNNIFATRLSLETVNWRDAHAHNTTNLINVHTPTQGDAAGGHQNDFFHEDTTVTTRFPYTLINDFVEDTAYSSPMWIKKFLQGPEEPNTAAYEELGPITNIKDRLEAMQYLQEQGHERDINFESDEEYLRNKEESHQNALRKKAEEEERERRREERRRLREQQEKEQQEKRKEEIEKEEEELQINDIIGNLPPSTVTRSAEKKPAMMTRLEAKTRTESIADAHNRLQMKQRRQPSLQVIDLGMNNETTTVHNIYQNPAGYVPSMDMNAPLFTLNTTVPSANALNNTMSCNTNYVGNTQSNNVIQDGMIIWYPQPRNATAEMVNQHNDRSAAYLNQMNQNYYNQGYGNQGYNNQGYGNQYYGNQDYYNQSYYNQGYYNQGYTQYPFPPFGGQ